MSYPSDPTDEQWELLEPVLNAPGKRGRTRGRWVVPDSVHESRASELMLEHLGG